MAARGGVSFADGATIDYVGDISNFVTSYAHAGYGYGTAATLDLLASTTADREVTVSVYGQGSYTMNTDGTVSGVADTTGNYYIAGNVNSSTILSSGDDLTTMSSLLVKSGTLTVDEAWTVPALQGTAGTIALSENLTLSKDSTLTGTILQGAGELIIGAGATLTVNSTARNMKSNIRVGSGATLEFLGTGADAIEYDQTGRTIYVDGGKIDVGTTRQTVGNWTFALTGARIQGAGQSSTANIGLDFHRSSTINVRGTEGATGENPTISTINTKVRIASGHTLTYDVAGTARLNQSGALQIDGTISKDGAGVLYLSGSNSGSGALNVVEGTLAVNAIAALASSTVTVQDGAVLDLTEVYGEHLVLTEWEAIENNTKLVTQEGGFIKVRTDHDGGSGGELNLDADGIKLTKNYLTSRVDVHAGGNTDGRALTIGSGATLKSTGEIKMVSNGKLVVDGGNLIAEYLTIGHTADSSHPGYLEMKSGSIKTGYINLINNNVNTISISGGALEFTTSSAIMRNDNASTTISIGGTAEAPVTLKASQVAWTLNGDRLTSKPTIGHVTIDGANTYGITLQNVNINGTITNNANLESQAAGLTLGAFTVAADATATIGGTGTTTLSGTVTNNGALTITGDLNGSATFVLNGGSNLLLNNGGEIAFNNKIAGAGFQASGTGTITIGDGTVVNLTNDGQIKQGAIAGHVVVLGGGELRLSGGKTLFGYDEGGTKSVTLRGTEGKTALMNITHASTNDTQHLSTDLILAGYATIQSSGSPLETYVKDGRGNITATGTNNLISANITLDRALTVTVTEETDTLEISGQISSTGSDKITKTGAGELVLSGANTYSVGTNISGGTVTTQNASALGSGGVNMTGGELVVSDVANTDTDLTVGGAIVMNAAATAKLVTSGTTLSLGTAGSVKKSNADGTQHVTIASNGTNAASMTAKADNAQLVQLQEDASFTIQDMTLTNTTITAATPTTQVNFSNVTVAGATVLRNMQASMTGANVAAGGSDGVKGEFTASTSLLSGITLANTDAVGSTIVVDLGDLSCAAPMGPGKYDLSITLSGFTMQDYTQGIVFAADSWLGQLLTAQGATAYVSGAVETPDSVSEGGSTGGVSVSYSTGNVGTIITINGLNVPEPASATLGLAALMMLCARRRRKA